MKLPVCSFTCIFCLSMGLTSCAFSPERGQEEAHVAYPAQEIDANGQLPTHNGPENPGQMPAAEPASVPTEGKRVQIMDQSLNMPMGTVNLPAGWKLHSDVASNPQGKGYLKFHLAVESPRGEIYGYLPPSMSYFMYSSMFAQNEGQDFEGLINTLMHYAAAPYLEKLMPGPIQPDRETMATKEIRELQQQHHQIVMRSVYETGIQSQPDFGVFKIEFRATRKQVPYKGAINSLKLGAIDQAPNMFVKSGTIMGSFLFAPETIYDAAYERGDVAQIQFSPQWNQRRSQIIDREAQQMAQNHQRRMQQQQQQFQSHQQHMASMRQGFEQQNKDWYDRNFSSYNSNAAVNDAITGHTTFSDPYTGHQIKQEGHYNYWYTNEFGEYHGTNDPSFQPGSQYSGNWQPIQPMKPRH